MNDHEIITLLDFYGHLRAPYGESREISKPLDQLTVSDQVVRDAIQSYQAFHAVAMEPIIAAFYPQRLSAAVKADGDLGPATRALLETARCACPDYDAALPAEMAGNGNWSGCYGIGPFHSAVVRFSNAPPAFLMPVFDQVWNRVVDAYAELGLLFQRDDNADHANIDVSFVIPDGGWIGLAIVGQGQSCGDRIWAKFDRRYQPANVLSEWTTLIKHELGHNCGLSHSNGGVMNPYIMAGLPVSWKGDPSYQLLASRFGGKPVPRNKPSRDLVLAWQTGPNQFEVIQKIDTTGSGAFWPN